MIKLDKLSTLPCKGLPINSLQGMACHSRGLVARVEIADVLDLLET